MINEVKYLCKRISKFLLFVLFLIMAFYSREGYLIMLKGSGKTPEQAIPLVLPFIAPIVLILIAVAFLINGLPIKGKRIITLYNITHFIGVYLIVLTLFFLVSGFLMYAEYSDILKSIAIIVCGLAILSLMLPFTLEIIADHKRKRT